jgi:hypothetical protein
MAAGKLTDDGDHTRDVALLSDTGEIHVLRATDEWRSPRVLGFRDAAATRLLCANVTPRREHDLLVMGPHAAHLVGSDGSQLATLPAETSLIGGIARRHGGNSLMELALLESNGAVTIATPVPGSTITVNTTLQSSDTAMAFPLAVEVADGTRTVESLTDEQRAQVSGTPGAGQLDQIAFDVPGTGPSVHDIGSVLIFDPVVITGALQLAGAGAGGPIPVTPVVLQGSMTISGGDSALIQVAHTGGSVLLSGGGENLIVACAFGATPDGLGPQPGINALNIASDSGGNMIGGPMGTNRLFSNLQVASTAGSENLILMNDFGLNDFDGAFPSAGTAITVQTADNQISENLIVEKQGESIIIDGAGAIMNLVENNVVGLAPGSPVGASLESTPGTRGAAPGGTNGIRVTNSASMTSVTSNTVVGTSLAGIEISGGATETLVQGNRVFVANTGILLFGANDNTVGGEVPLTGGDPDVGFFPGNTVTLCSQEAVLLQRANRNDVQGNGLGTVEIVPVLFGGLGRAGVVIDGRAFLGASQDNLIGGDTPGSRNLIAFSGLIVTPTEVISSELEGVGVLIEGSLATMNRVQGNHIGGGATGGGALPNRGPGVLIRDRASDNLIGGEASSEGNLISLNEVGVRITRGASSVGGTDRNRVEGNLIGVGVDGLTPFGNRKGGVVIDGGAGENVIGGDTVGSRNVIAGNGAQAAAQGEDGPGIWIAEGGTDENRIEGNVIGLGIDGMTAIPNHGPGVLIDDLADDNVVGGEVALSALLEPLVGRAPGNIISGNLGPGVAIAGSGNVVRGNMIGLAADGKTPRGNGEDGVLIFVAGTTNVRNNEVGGPKIEHRNVISGNGSAPGDPPQSGVRVQGVVDPPSRLGATLIRGNIIGLTADGSQKRGNISNGVTVSAAADTQVGGSAMGEGNLISGNLNHGVFIESITASLGSGTAVVGNTIGPGAAGQTGEGNRVHGVFVTDSFNVRVGEGNIVAHNGLGATPGGGVVVDANTLLTTGHTITRNAIHSNGTLGIDLEADGVTANDTDPTANAANRGQNFPGISLVTTTSAEGSLESVANAGFTIELFASATPDPTTFGEGQVFVGSTPASTDANGVAQWVAVSLPIPPDKPWITATATRLSTRDTSEFSKAVMAEFVSFSDWGDAPEGVFNQPGFPTRFENNGARHALLAGLSLGALVDAELSGQPTPLADGDDAAGDDEDGIEFQTLLEAGTTAQVEVSAALGGQSQALLSGFIDFNRDRDWSDPGEQVFTDTLLTESATVLNIAVPATAEAGFSFARFRLSTDSGLSFDGAASDGEVEDERVLLVRAGGLPDPATLAAALVGSSEPSMEFDITGDGIVDATDLVALINALNALP